MTTGKFDSARFAHQRMGAFLSVLQVAELLYNTCDTCGPLADPGEQTTPPRADFCGSLADLHRRGSMCGGQGGPGVVFLTDSDMARLDALMARDFDAQIDAADAANDPNKVISVARERDAWDARWSYLRHVVRRGLSAMEADHVDHIEMGDFARLIREAMAKK